MRIFLNFMITPFAALVIPGCRSIEDRGGYVKADVYSIPFLIERVVAVKTHEVPNWGSMMEHVVITEPTVLDNLAGRIDKLIPIEGYRGMDTRITCVLSRRDGDRDTLAFGNLGIEFNGRLCEADTLVLAVVGERLPEGHRLQVNKWIAQYRRGFFQPWPK